MIQHLNGPNFPTNSTLQTDLPKKEHLITPATMLTAARPVLAGVAAKMLLKGQRGALPVMAVAAITDKEGSAATFMDTHYPELERGSTELGTSLDPVADSLAFLEIGAGVIASPRASNAGKAAVGLVLATELKKAQWAFAANAVHEEKTGEKLVIKPGQAGRVATTLKFMAETSAVATHDLNPGKARDIAGKASLGFAVAGSILGEHVRRGYARQLKKQY